jgi:hypothetical protein
MSAAITAEAAGRLSARPPWLTGLSRKSPTVAPSGRVRMKAAQNSSTRDGTVNLSGRVTRMQASGSGHWGLLPTHVTDFGPDLKFLGPRSSMLCGSDVIAAEVEKVIDLIVG